MQKIGYLFHNVLQFAFKFAPFCSLLIIIHLVYLGIGCNAENRLFVSQRITVCL